MRINLFARLRAIFTHEGGRAVPITALPQLRRSVLSCLLWEREFYEDGEVIGERIAAFARQVPPEQLAALAREARGPFNLRHAPLLLLSVLAETAQGPVVSDAIADVLQRADEPGELLALHAKRLGKPVKKAMTHAMRRGLARALARFDEYELAKYDRDVPVKLRDVLFLSHAKPANEAQAELWRRLAARELATPDTWEVELSAGADKKATFERLIRDGRLGYLALLRNLRLMMDAGCDADLVRAAILARKGARRVLPFRYVAAARACPQLEPALDQALAAAVAATPALPGRTVVLVDVSGSMAAKLSRRSDLQRMDAAAALAVIVPGEARTFTFAEELVEVPSRPGMAGIDAIIASQPHGGTYLAKALAQLHERVAYDRIIVVTDEQSHDGILPPRGKGYLINVASARNGVGYGPWLHIDGFSEAVLRFVAEHERHTPPATPSSPA